LKPLILIRKKTDIIMIHNHPTWVIKSMIYRLVILSISLLVVGCVSTSNVLELGRDTYTVSATADGFRDAASARQSAFKAGAEKCNSLSKKFLLTNENVANTRMGIDTTVTLYFRCLDERDSEYVRPHLQKAPDLLIESK
jgi:hypothetical protein